MRASRMRTFLKIIVLAFPLSWLVYLITDTNVSEDVKYVRGLHPYEIVPPKVENEDHQNVPATRAIVANFPQEQNFVTPGNKRDEEIGLPKEKDNVLENIGDGEILPPKIEDGVRENNRDERIEPPKAEGEPHQNVMIDVHANVVDPPENEKSPAPENKDADEIGEKMEAPKVLKPPLPPQSQEANGDTPEKFDYGPQSAMLKEIGGYVMNKMPPGFFQNVSLPRFVNAYDPKGLGEGGKAVYIPDKNLTVPEVKKEFEQGWLKNSFNQFVSDRVSIHRSLPHGKSEACQKQALGYSESLPDVSVVIIFHNEAWSVLLRSVHSLLDRTPEHLLREIMLVDDFSAMEHLKAPLEKYFNDFPKVKIVRCTKRQGLTRARLLGFHASTAPIVVFLDSHIECFPGCLVPLIQRVYEKPTSVVFPSIEGISAKTLSLSATVPANLGIFSWKDLTFNWAFLPEVLKQSRANDSVPIKSPTMPGGLFAISRWFFEKLGTYDPGLDYWGGENIELSFKAWMCGGCVELVTCSHIGHIFRRSNPIKWSTNLGHKNSIRVAEVWMDDFKNYFYERLNFDLKNYGDVSERKALRQRLGCKSFKWYLQNAYSFIKLPNDVLYVGEIRSAAFPKCIDSMGGPTPSNSEPRMYTCHGMGSNQLWVLHTNGLLAQEEWKICFHTRVVLQRRCTEGHRWIYEAQTTRTIRHLPSGLCLTSSVTNDTVSLQTCSASKWQKWTMPSRRKDINFPSLE